MELFNFDNNEVRVVYLGDTKAPWWVAVDVCRALCMDMRHGATPYVRRLEPTEKFMVSRDTLNSDQGVAPLFKGSSGKHSSQFILINESGLYKLIMRSDKLEARRFQTWITCEVLPALRRDGYYVTEEVRREHEFAAGEGVHRQFRPTRQGIEIPKASISGPL